MKNHTRQAIVVAAQKLFSTSGYDGTSMDAIAAEARVTKMTIYRHFQDKDATFSAALQGFLDDLPAAGSIVSERGGSLRLRLTASARHLITLATSAFMFRLHRMLTIVPHSSAATAADLWDATFRPYSNEVQSLLTEAQASGVLEIDDTGIAETHLLSLVVGKPMARLFLTGVAFGDDDDVEKHIDAAVDMFLRAYGPGCFARVKSPDKPGTA